MSSKADKKWSSVRKKYSKKKSNSRGVKINFNTGKGFKTSNGKKVEGTDFKVKKRSSSSKKSSSSSSSNKLPEGAIASKVGGGYIYAEGKEPVSKLKKTNSKNNNVVRGTLELPKKKTIGTRIYDAVTPKRGDSKIERGIKGVGRFGADTIFGIGAVATTSAKAITGDKRAQQTVRNVFTKDTVKNIGAGLGKQVQSSDPYQKTQGLLGFFSTFYGVKTPGSKTKLNIDKTKTTTKVNSVENIGSNSVKVNINSKGKLTNGKDFVQSIVLRQDKNTKKVTGQVKTKVDGKTTNTKVNLKDEGGFYVDKKNNIKVSKSKLNPDKVDYKLTEVKTTQSKKDNKRTLKGEIITTGQRQVSKKTTKGTISKNKKSEVTKVKNSNVDFAVDSKGKPIDVKGIKQSLTATYQKKRTAKQKQVDDRRIKAFLKAADYDKTIVNGLDRRTRLARALGLQKSSSKIKKLETYAKDNKLIKVERKGTIKTSTTIGPKKAAKSQTIAKGFGKKGQLLLKKKKLSKTDKDNVLKTPKTIDIPKLEVRIQLIKALKVRGLVPKTRSDQVIRQIQNKIEDVKNKQDQKRKQDQQRVQDQPQTQTPKKTNSPATKNPKKPSAPPKTPRKPTNPRKNPKRPPKKLPKLSWDSEPPKGYKWKLDGFVNIKGKRTKVSSGLPPNKTFNKVFSKGSSNYRGVDKSTAQSFEFEIVGITKAKDSRKSKAWNKVTTSKGSSKNVLKLKEKNSARIDTKGEKKGLKIAKKTTKKTSKKTTKKSSTKKNTNASKRGKKTLKSSKKKK